MGTFNEDDAKEEAEAEAFFTANGYFYLVLFNPKNATEGDPYFGIEAVSERVALEEAEAFLSDSEDFNSGLNRVGLFSVHAMAQFNALTGGLKIGPGGVWIFPAPKIVEDSNNVWAVAHTVHSPHSNFRYLIPLHLWRNPTGIMQRAFVLEGAAFSKRAPDVPANAFFRVE